MTTNPIPIIHENALIPSYVGLTDDEIARLLKRGVAALQ